MTRFYSEDPYLAELLWLLYTTFLDRLGDLDSTWLYFTKTVIKNSKMKKLLQKQFSSNFVKICSKMIFRPIKATENHVSLAVSRQLFRRPLAKSNCIEHVLRINLEFRRYFSCMEYPENNWLEKVLIRIMWPKPW